MIYIEESLSLFSTFACKRSSHRCKSAAWHNLDMVWLYRTPIPEGRIGVFFFQMISTVYQPSLRWGEGEGEGSAPCVVTSIADVVHKRSKVIKESTCRWSILLAVWRCWCFFTLWQCPARPLKTHYLGIIKLFPAMESLVSDIPAGDVKIAIFFYSVRPSVAWLSIRYDRRIRGALAWKERTRLVQNDAVEVDESRDQ